MSTDLAYVAGFLDGEGCLSIAYNGTTKLTKNQKFNSKIRISNTHLGVLEKIHNILGCSGKIRKMKVYGNAKPAWEFNVHIKDHIKVLESLLPYFIIKKQQAECLIKFRKTYKDFSATKPIPKSTIKARENLHNIVSNLNHN